MNVVDSNAWLEYFANDLTRRSYQKLLSKLTRSWFLH